MYSRIEKWEIMKMRKVGNDEKMDKMELKRGIIN